MIRMVSTARILMPKSKIRLSAGREKLSKEAQILCIQCGANSIFYGDELLTTSNPSFEEDRQLLKEVGVRFNTDFGSKNNVVFAKHEDNYIAFGLIKDSTFHPKKLLIS